MDNATLKAIANPVFSYLVKRAKQVGLLEGGNNGRKKSKDIF